MLVEEAGRQHRFFHLSRRGVRGVLADSEDCPVAQSGKDHVTESQFGVVVGVSAVQHHVAAVGSGQWIRMD